MKLGRLSVGLIVSIFSCSGRASEIDEARSLVTEWVGVEKLISEESAGWSAEKDILSDMVALLKEEKASLGERIEEAAAAMTEADTKRADLVAERDEYIGAMEFMKGKIGDLEAKVLGLYTRFPPPLQEEISLVYNRVPKDGEKSRLSISQRLQSLVAILSQADKFNGGVQMVSEIQQVGSGQAEVDILYFGLGGAFFQDKNGLYSGVGYPTAEGWVWREAPESSEAISDLFAVYLGGQEAEFVNLPVSIK